MDELDKRYLKNYGMRCPVCGSEDITDANLEPCETVYIFQNVWCRSCLSEWTDVFELCGISELQLPESFLPAVVNAGERTQRL